MIDDKGQIDYEDGTGEPGVCPYCGGLLSFDDAKKDEEGFIFPWTCNDCGKQGKETYEVFFTGHYHK